MARWRFTLVGWYDDDLHTYGTVDAETEGEAWNKAFETFGLDLDADEEARRLFGEGPDDPDDEDTSGPGFTIVEVDEDGWDVDGNDFDDED